MKEKITKRTVDALPAGDFIVDTEIKGFVARRLPSGVVTYGFQYRTPDGRRPWMSLGLHGSITADEARVLAKKRAGEVADNRDPAAEQRAAIARSENTVSAVLDEYIERDVRARGLRTVAAIESAFDRLVRPVIGTRSIYDLKKSDLIKMLDGIADDSGPVMADRTLAYVRAAFRWQSNRDDDFTPPLVKARTKPSERRRDRILDDQEIRDVWLALSQLEPSDEVPVCYPQFVRLLLLTAQRRTNVARIHADEVNGDIWLIPAEQTKNKRPHLVPLTQAVIEMLGEGDAFFISSDDGQTAFSGYSKAKRALDKKIAAMRKAEGRKPMQHWTLHDLRRTSRSLMSRYATPDVAERVIGHAITGVRGVYDLYEYADEKRAALESLASRIAAIVGEQSGQVVEFPERKSSGGEGTATLQRVVGS
jgi:integrase